VPAIENAIVDLGASENLPDIRMVVYGKKGR
jgi:hypothetical protein